jgi:hypothetical protein
MIVHVWGGISKKGQTGICMFERIMDRFLFTDILEQTLVPFITEKTRPKEFIPLTACPQACRYGMSSV